MAPDRQKPVVIASEAKQSIVAPGDCRVAGLLRFARNDSWRRWIAALRWIASLRSQ
ncbi:MAG: hypothetical protein LBS91_09670 [Clostridiales Family XIII bacterium]|jgi:hypothetical protein|nr:hypothetical protein [Clostridiales Family XIII bacterium]